MIANKQINRKVLTTAITTAIIASTQVSQALAQDQAAEANSEDTLLEEVIVTATSRATTTQDIPYNISALKGSDIQEFIR